MVRRCAELAPGSIISNRSLSLENNSEYTWAYPCKFSKWVDSETSYVNHRNPLSTF